MNTNADGGSGNLRQAIIDINNGSDSSNTINLEIFNNSPIILQSDLPVIKKNTVINSTGKQPIDGQGKYRLFATIMADLTINNCTLQNGAAIGGNGHSGGLRAGGGGYIDRGNTLTLKNTTIIHCKAEGGKGLDSSSHLGGGGASFSSFNKHATTKTGSGDFPGQASKYSGGSGLGGDSDGSLFMKGYGGGDGIIKEKVEAMGRLKALMEAIVEAEEMAPGEEMEVRIARKLQKEEVEVLEAVEGHKEAVEALEEAEGLF